MCGDNYFSCPECNNYYEYVYPSMCVCNGYKCNFYHSMCLCDGYICIDCCNSDNIFKKY